MRATERQKLVRTATVVMGILTTVLVLAACSPEPASPPSTSIACSSLPLHVALEWDAQSADIDVTNSNPQSCLLAGRFGVLVPWAFTTGTPPVLSGTLGPGKSLRQRFEVAPASTCPWTSPTSSAPAMIGVTVEGVEHQIATTGFVAHLIRDCMSATPMPISGQG